MHSVAVSSHFFRGHRVFILLVYPFHLRSTGDYVGVCTLHLGICRSLGDVFRVWTIDFMVEFQLLYCFGDIPRDCFLVWEAFYVQELLVSVNCIHTWDGKVL